MAHTDLADAAACCERALAAIRSETWEEIAPGLTVTASVGIAGAGEAERFDDVAALADTRLYAAKRGGRDRVVAQQP
jgi:PleD family two-component response regulator